MIFRQFSSIDKILKRYTSSLYGMISNAVCVDDSRVRSWHTIPISEQKLPEMIPGHVLNVLVNHVKPDSFWLAIAPYGPRVLVAVVTLRFGRRRHHAARRRRRYPVLVDTRYHYTGYHFAQSVGQQHLQMHPNRALKRKTRTWISSPLSFVRKVQF